MARTTRPQQHKQTLMGLSCKANLGVAHSGNWAGVRVTFGATQAPSGTAMQGEPGHGAERKLGWWASRTRRCTGRKLGWWALRPR
eukprot:13169289-Alexandrium_andersonii.AAC.1